MQSDDQKASRPPPVIALTNALTPRAREKGEGKKLLTVADRCRRELSRIGTPASIKSPNSRTTRVSFMHPGGCTTPGCRPPHPFVNADHTNAAGLNPHRSKPKPSVCGYLPVIIQPVDQGLSSPTGAYWDGGVPEVHAGLHHPVLASVAAINTTAPYPVGSCAMLGLPPDR